MSSKRVDLSVLAENGMRRGRTTGTCATAAAQAAVLAFAGATLDEVEVLLPDGCSTLLVPIAAVHKLSEIVRVEVIKDAGDDPDVTDGATIFCELKPNQSTQHRLFAVEGVGTVTEPGLRVAIGEPAINPAPRQMILSAVDRAAQSSGLNQKFDLAIGCVNGETIAQKTFNPRLGIRGGISILGTTGIVEPMSLAAWQAAVEVYIRVGICEAEQIAFLPGNIGITFARSLGLLQKQIITISNFIGFSMDTLRESLTESGGRLERLWILGHPGKLVKPLAGHWDTHSKASPMAMDALADFAELFGLPTATAIRNCNTVEAAIELIQQRHPDQSGPFWSALEIRLSDLFAERVSIVPNVQVRLFDMAGKTLSGRAAA